MLGSALPSGAERPAFGATPGRAGALNEHAVDGYRAALRACKRTLYQGVHENDSPGPRVAVLGDSAENQLRSLGLADPFLHWIYGTQCGEQFRTAIDDGRLDQVLASNPHVLVLALGNNDFNQEFQFRPDLVPMALEDIQRTLDLTEDVPCRVIVNLPNVAPLTMSIAQRISWQSAAAEINEAFEAAQARPGVHVADWASVVDRDWQRYTIEAIHLTRAGIKARRSLELSTMRQCPKPTTS